MAKNQNYGYYFRLFRLARSRQKICSFCTSSLKTKIIQIIVHFYLIVQYTIKPELLEKYPKRSSLENKLRTGAAQEKNEVTEPEPQRHSSILFSLKMISSRIQLINKNFFKEVVCSCISTFISSLFLLQLQNSVVRYI